MNTKDLIEATRRLLWKSVEPLLFVVVVFAPWAFNSYPPPYAQILHLLVTLFAVVSLAGRPPVPVPSFGATLVGKLFLATLFLFLTYVLVSVLNARAVAILGGSGVGLEYREAILWLPHSYSQNATRQEWYWQIVLSGAFFGACRWVRSQAVQHSRERSSNHWMPGIRKLLWVLSMSSGLMAIEAIIQRLSHTNYLLFLRPMYTWSFHLDAHDSLGPFSYQGTGTAYFNFIWPLTLGLWWTNQLREFRRTGVRPKFGSRLDSILPIAALLMILSIFFTTSRTGVGICLLQICAMGLLVCFSRKTHPKFLKISIVGAGLLIASSIAFVGVDPILKKMDRIRTDDWGGRLQVYRQVLRMIPDFDPWGAGAASFADLSDLYTPATEGSWESMVHNDWLEARLSYGMIGFGILLALAILAFLEARNRKLRVLPAVFTPFLWISLAGMGLHGCVDIPFQSRTLHLLFALGCAIALYATPKSANFTPETV